jgi:hypothetical protein
MFDETALNGTAPSAAKPDSRRDPGEWILSGPHFFVGNPFYKTPRSVCTQNSHYDILDLETLPHDYLPRTNYVPACTPDEYLARTTASSSRSCANTKADTWYDTRGRIVFTPSKGLVSVGLPRKARKAELDEGTRYGIHAPIRSEQSVALGWEDIRDLQEGTVTKTFLDDTLPGGPTERTIEYHAPFHKPDREEDYRTAWAIFEKRGIKPTKRGSDKLFNHTAKHQMAILPTVFMGKRLEEAIGEERCKDLLTTDKYSAGEQGWDTSTRRVSPCCNCFNCRRTLPSSWKRTTTSTSSTATAASPWPHSSTRRSAIG